MNGYDKLNKTLPALLLLFFVSLIAIFNIASPDRAFSESENRMLVQLPRFSLKALLSGTFTSDFEKYVSDQFAFRDLWIGAKTDTDRLLGKKESNGVYLGKDGYLIQKFVPPAEGDLEAKMEAVHAFDDATPGLRKYAMIVPTAAAVLQDKLPKYAETGVEEAYLGQIRQKLPSDIRFVDVFPALYAERDQPIFYKTDHHWTTQGAHAAYLELCKQMGLKPQNEEGFRIRQVTGGFYGSLYSKSGFRHLRPDGIQLYLPKEQEKYTVTYVGEGQTSDSLYAMDQLQKKDKYAVFLNGNHALIRIQSARPNGKKLLVVKDSYANSFIPFLLGHFGEIDVADLRYYEDDLAAFVKEQGIQDMLLLYNVNTFFEDPSILNLE
ncbi:MULTISPECIES: DHHW family protein [Paenibacillus]|uniref:Membrane protein n=1 Tax=Paenibacillus albilobatus TaxID=2716884 RepID=A0A919XN99_9BACL|nr:MULTISPECIES: DHHW family protein [Paenibacillus]GIO34538.1 membrane protein [Paenibacillus albilobatus]